MNDPKAPVLILGQGLAGSVLALSLDLAGVPFRVLSHPEKPRASEKAAGLVNPVTGRRMALTWGYDFIFPAAVSFYREAYTRIYPGRPGSFLEPRLLLRALHQTEEMNFISAKSADRGYSDLLTIHSLPRRWPEIFSGMAGWCETAGGFRMDVPGFLDSVQTYISAQGRYQEGIFSEDKLQASGSGFVYDGLSYRCVVSALGLGCPWLKDRLWPSKGQLFELEGLPDWGTDVLKTEHFFIPTGKGTVLAGSTYERGATHPEPDEAGKKVVLGSLTPGWQTGVRVLRAWAGFRPTTPDRRPILEEVKPGIFTLNGLGSKGVSLSPWAAAQVMARINPGLPARPSPPSLSQ
jgi:glycine/D-amino acid oxidase-like deaminating enzyme